MNLQIIGFSYKDIRGITHFAGPHVSRRVCFFHTLHPRNIGGYNIRLARLKVRGSI
jgi:hypothetical protein